MLELHLKKYFGRLVYIAAAFTAFGFGAVGAIILVNQSFGWLKTGYWRPESISKALARMDIILYSDWVGLNQMLQWVGSLHIAVLLVWCAVACIFIAAYGVMTHEDADREIRLRRNPPEKAW